MKLSLILADRVRFDQLHRREFITLLGGAAAVWPLGASAEQRPAGRREMP